MREISYTVRRRVTIRVPYQDGMTCSQVVGLGAVIEVTTFEDEPLLKGSYEPATETLRQPRKVQNH